MGCPDPESSPMSPVLWLQSLSGHGRQYSLQATDTGEVGDGGALQLRFSEGMGPDSACSSGRWLSGRVWAPD